MSVEQLLQQAPIGYLSKDEAYLLVNPQGRYFYKLGKFSKKTKNYAVHTSWGLAGAEMFGMRTKIADLAKKEPKIKNFNVVKLTLSSLQ